MDQQAKIAGRNGAPKTESQGLAWDVGAFANDVLTLTELQSQLFLADLRECSRRIMVPSLLLLGGLSLALACGPIALVTGALGLVHFFEISHFAAFLIIAVAGAVCSMLLCIVGWLMIRQRVVVLGRSREELSRNLRWIKRVLTRKRPSSETSSAL